MSTRFPVFPIVISHIPRCEGCVEKLKEIERLKEQHDEELRTLFGLAEEERQKLLTAIRRESHHMEERRVHGKDDDMKLKKIGHSKDVKDQSNG